MLDPTAGDSFKNKHNGRIIVIDEVRINDVGLIFYDSEWDSFRLSELMEHWVLLAED
tara:strand:+ start:495 stop:665 length:171 start_codon:yes stop_codon:yes gene_type:complete